MRLVSRNSFTLILTILLTAFGLFSGAPIFTLSPRAGRKTVYFKVKNMDGESPVAVATIVLDRPGP